MLISIIGLGYVGATTAAVLASWDHQVQIFDVDFQKCKSFLSSTPEIYEVGLVDLIDKHHVNIKHVASYKEIIQSDIIFICVDTPYFDGNLDISRVINVLDELNKTLGQSTHVPDIAIRSTVTPDLDAILFNRYPEHLNHKIYLNPEFLREGSAIDDFNNPPKVVIGCPDSEPKKLLLLYDHLNCPKFVMPFKSVTVTKLIDNSWHATKVAFGNEIGRILKDLELNHSETLKPFFADTKLNISARYLLPGAPFGGSCLTKDLNGLVALSSNLGSDTPLLKNVSISNDCHFMYIAKKISLLRSSAKILVFGVPFKSSTNDLRETPSLILGSILRDFGHQVCYYDDQIEKSDLSSKQIEVGLLLDANFNVCWIDRTELHERYDILVNFKNYVPSFLSECYEIEWKI